MGFEVDEDPSLYVPFPASFSCIYMSVVLLNWILWKKMQVDEIFT